MSVGSLTFSNCLVGVKTLRAMRLCVPDITTAGMEAMRNAMEQYSVGYRGIVEVEVKVSCALEERKDLQKPW